MLRGSAPSPPNDDLSIGGLFRATGGHTSAYWARMTCITPSTCFADADCDGDVDFFDIDPFVGKIGCPGIGASCDDACPWQNADADQDGDVDFFDIDPFVALLGTTCP